MAGVTVGGMALWDSSVDQETDRLIYALVYTDPMYIVDNRMTVGEMDDLKSDSERQKMSNLEQAYLLYHAQALSLGR